MLKYTIPQSIFKKEEDQPKDPYTEEIKKIQRKKRFLQEDYARFYLLRTAATFWENPAKVDLSFMWGEKSPLLKIEKDSPPPKTNSVDLALWLRCFLLVRFNYELLAKESISTIKAYIEQANILELWKLNNEAVREAADGLDANNKKKFMDHLETGLDVDFFDLPYNTEYGFNIPNPDKNLDPLTRLFFSYRKMNDLKHAVQTLHDMILFFKISDWFLELLGKTVKLCPVSFQIWPKKWNEILLGVGDIFSEIETRLLSDELTQTSRLNRGDKYTLDLQETREFWKGLCDKIKYAVDYIPDERKPELKQVKRNARHNPYFFFRALSDLDFLFEPFGAVDRY